MLGIFTAALIMTALGPGMTWAATSLLRDVQYQEQAEHIDLSVRLGLPIEVTSLQADNDGQTLRLILQYNEADPDRQWRASELRFEEADRLLETVAIEGSEKKGFALTLTFTASVVAQLLPQFDTHQVLLKLARHSDYRAISRSGRVQNGDPYVINLESRQQSVPRLEDLPPGYASSHTVYVTRYQKDGQLWNRLRLGFFADQARALSTANVLRRYYPEAWVDQVSANEVRFAEAFLINPATQMGARFPGADAADAATEDVSMTIVLATPASLDAIDEPAPDTETAAWQRREPIPEQPLSHLEEMTREAQLAFEEEQWPTAISRFGAIVEAGQEPFRQRALEMLGVSREMNDQSAHAKRYYELYSAEYPDTEGADRVAQRLAALTAFDGPGKQTVRTATVSSAPAWQSGLQFSQFYQRYSVKVDGRSSVPIDGVFNDLNLMSRREGDDLDQEVRVTMSYLLDFTDNERLDGKEFQISTAYWEGYSDRFSTGIRIGRQSNWLSGALGRFDGASLNHSFTDNLGLGFTGGYLIDSSFDSPNTDRPFIGISGEYLTDSGNLSFKPFFVQQHVDGLVDRQALGLQSQYYSERLMLFSLIDYDLHYSALNNLTLTGNFTFGRSQLNASYEHRKNPYLTTRNALMGQSFDDLTELEEALLDLSLEEIANDRTAESNTVRLGLNSRFGQWTFSADVVATDFSRTESSADVTGLEPHNTLYSSFQIRSADVFGAGSYSGLMLRVANSDTSDTTSMYWDNRFRLGSSWFFYPRLRVDLRKFSRTGDEQTTLRPTLRLDYRMSRRIRFELEGGYEWSTRDMADRELDITGLFFRAGYRASL